jgi:hypothetical protein
MNFPSTNIDKSVSTESSSVPNARNPREKPYVSPDVIRQKLESHKAGKQKPAVEQKVESPLEAKNVSKPEIKPQANLEVKAAPIPAATVEVGPTKMPPLKEVEAAQEAVVPTTSLLNDPKAPETQEKLRHLISNGGFNFSDKERKVLGEVLKT